MGWGKGKWVFPSQGRKVGRGHIADCRAVIDKITESTGITFTCHDLRRTFISTAERLDVNYYALKALVNHKMSGDVTAGYVIPDTDRLRGPMEKITAYLLARAEEPGQMRIAQ